MSDDHMIIYAAETTAPSEWDHWADQLANLFAAADLAPIAYHPNPADTSWRLDGDETRGDAWSVDWIYEQYKAGRSVDQVLEDVQIRVNARDLHVHAATRCDCCQHVEQWYTARLQDAALWAAEAGWQQHEAWTLCPACGPQRWNDGGYCDECANGGGILRKQPAG